MRKVYSKDSEYYRKHKERNRIASNKFWKKNRANGWCGKCGIDDPIINPRTGKKYSYCEICRVANNERCRAYYRRKHGLSTDISEVPETKPFQETRLYEQA